MADVGEGPDKNILAPSAILSTKRVLRRAKALVSVVSVSSFYPWPSLNAIVLAALGTFYLIPLLLSHDSTR